MKKLLISLLYVLILVLPALAQDADKEESPQTQTKPGRIKVMSEDEIKGLLDKLDELERLKRGQQYFKVLAVDTAECKLLLINGGWEDGLKQGFRLEVFRKNHIITKIELIEVLQEECIGRILSKDDYGKAEAGDLCKLLPYVPFKKSYVKNPEEAMNPEEKPEKTDEDDKTESPFELRELEDLLADTLIEKQKLENENRALSEELFVKKQDYEALELEIRRDEKGYSLLKDKLDEVLRNNQLGNHLGIYLKLDFAYGMPTLNGFSAGEEDIYYNYCAGTDFYSAEGLKFRAEFSLLQQWVHEHDEIAGIFSLDVTFYERITVGFRDYQFINQFNGSENSSEFIFRMQSLPDANNIAECLNVLEIEEIKLNYGLEIVMDYDSGTGTDYRFFAGLNNFFIVMLNYNQDYWSDSGRFGFLHTELRGTLPVYANFVEVWLMAKITYQIALNETIYKDSGAAQFSIIIYF
ncbi:MAG: hypothetical protein K8S87_11840 [Planctomycetes bacterium]|nr:hypothetical protein [Planctomycetota bacterium]